MRFIFDLDGTVIDSRHRHATLADGSLDLEHWVENSTPEKIRQDSLLPIADLMRRVFPMAETLICTARVMGDADYEFLFDHGLHADAILSRPQGNRLPDAYLKEMLLRDHATRREMTWQQFTQNATMYDDNETVLSVMEFIGIKAYNARVINSELS